MRVVFGFGLIFVVALALRLWGIGFGLPELYHPDEPAYVLQALAIARGLPNGLTFANPPLYKYLLLGEYAVVYTVQRLVGSTHSPQEFIEQFLADPSTLYLLARGTSALLGALTSIAAGALATTVAGTRAGAIAAALTAVSFLLVRDAHFGVNDALVTFLVTLGLVFCVRIAADGARRDYVAAGALGGLAFTAKYYGIALLLPLVIAHFARARRNLADLGVAIGVCIAAVGLTFPALLTEPGRVLGDVYQHLVVDALGGYDGLDPAGGYAFYAKTLVVGLGWPLLIACMAGVGLALARRNRPALVVAGLPVALLLVLGASRLYFARFALPVLPPLIVEASVALDALLTWRLGIGVAVTVLAAAPTLVDATRFDTLMTQTDTRSLAREWISANVPAHMIVAVDAAPLGPRLPETGQASVASDWSLFDLTPAEYRARGVDYIVVSSFTSEARAVDPARDARRQAFNASLPREAAVVAQFRPYMGDREPQFVYDQIYAPFTALERLVRPGPTITIYRLTR